MEPAKGTRQFAQHACARATCVQFTWVQLQQAEKKQLSKGIEACSVSGGSGNTDLHQIREVMLVQNALVLPVPPPSPPPRTHTRECQTRCLKGVSIHKVP